MLLVTGMLARCHGLLFFQPLHLPNLVLPPPLIYIPLFPKCFPLPSFLSHILPIFQETFHNNLSPYCSSLKSIGCTVCTVHVRSLHGSVSLWAWFAYLPDWCWHMMVLWLSAQAQGGSLLSAGKVITRRAIRLRGRL